MEKYIVVIQKSGNNFGAYSPDVAGCVATGETVETTLNNMKEALEWHLEAMIEDGENVPEGKGLAYYVSLNKPFSEPTDFITELLVQIPLLHN